jgi:antimicrobial peptide system SdpA family protein
MDYSKKNKFYFLLNLSLSTIFVLLVFINSIGYNLLTINKKWAIEFQYLFPQGWAFFTKDPRGEQTYIYNLNKSEMKLLNLRNSAKESCFGISRKNRIILIEEFQIINQIDSTKWKIINSQEDLIFFKDTSKSIDIINFVNKPELIGEYIFLKQKTLPWSWSWNKSLYMPAKAIKIKLSPL